MSTLNDPRVLLDRRPAWDQIETALVIKPKYLKQVIVDNTG